LSTVKDLEHVAVERASGDERDPAPARMREVCAALAFALGCDAG
jgi:hypothetical protein